MKTSMSVGSLSTGAKMYSVKNLKIKINHRTLHDSYSIYDCIVVIYATEN